MYTSEIFIPLKDQVAIFKITESDFKINANLHVIKEFQSFHFLSDEYLAIL